MQPRLGAFAGGVEVGQVGTAVAVDHDPAAGVMLRGHDRDRPRSHVDAEPEQLLVDVGEMPPHEFGIEMADVEVDVVEAVALDLGVDRAGDDIARGEFGALVVIGHEALAGLRILQVPAFAAHRFGDQEILDLEIVEAGRVELHEFHVRHARTGAPGHRDAVAGRAARGGGEQISTTRAAGRQDGRARGVAHDPAGAAFADRSTA